MAYRWILKQTIPEGKVEWQGLSLLRVELKLLANGNSNLLFWVRNDGFDEEIRYRVFISKNGLAFLPGHFLVKRLFSEIIVAHLIVRLNDFEKRLRHQRKHNY